MGHRRPRLSVFGTVGVVVALLLVAVLWSSQRSGATTVRGTDATLAEPALAPAVEGAVQADGAPEYPPDGWSVERPETGRYLVTVPAGVANLDVISWDPVANVSVKPLTETVTELRFVRGLEPIDARFTFIAPLPG